MPRCFGTSGSVRASSSAEVGVVRAGRPHLLPVDDELVTVAHGARAEVRQVGTRVGLAEQLAPHLVGAQQRTEVPRLFVRGPCVINAAPASAIVDTMNPLLTS